MSDGLLLVGHGSRTDAGRAELLELGRLVASATDDPVAIGFLELTDPPAGDALDDLVARGADRIAVVPLMLNAAGHSKSDVPAVVHAARARHRDTAIAFGRPLGVDHTILHIAAARITAVGGVGRPLLVVARGTSEPEANADAARVARLLAEWVGAPWVLTAFSGLTWPSVPDALAQCRALGATEIISFAWYLSTGVLVERIERDLAAFADTTGIEVRSAGHLGPDPALVEVVLARYDEALRGPVSVNCDVCSYRAPWPGREARVAQPIGVGHSVLAADHRHHHH